MNRLWIFLHLVWRDCGYGFRFGVREAWEIAGILDEYGDELDQWERL